MSPRPVVTASAEELYASLTPGGFTDGDEAQGWALLNFCEALAGKMLEPVNELVRDGALGEPGWSSILDANRAPAYMLPWLAQLVGVRFPTDDLPVLEQRNRIKSTDGWQRGTVAAIRGAAALYLTGSKYVFFRERYDPDDPTGDYPYRLYVATLPAETPDSAKVLSALLEQKPMGVRLKYTVTGSLSSYEGVAAYHATYQTLLDTYANYNSLSPIATGNLTQIGEQKTTLGDIAGTLAAVA